MNPNIGNEGKKFSSEYQPFKNGRKPHIMTDTIRSLEEAGYKGVSREEIKKIWSLFLNLSKAELESIDSDEHRPMSERIVAKKMLGAKGDEMLSELQDRIFGKADQKVNIEGPVKIKVNIIKTKSE